MQNKRLGGKTAVALVPHRDDHHVVMASKTGKAGGAGNTGPAFNKLGGELINLVVYR
jgi:hypothetical protein